MPVKSKAGSWGANTYVAPPSKKTRQGNSKNTKYAATSRNAARKPKRGQG